MGGINSLGGLNKVNVDFRPTVANDAPNNANANQPQQVQQGVPEVQPHAAATPKSVVRQLDVLMLNAASKSEPTVTLKAAESRLDDAIQHAKKLADEGKVYKQTDWQDPEKRKAMKPLDRKVTITKPDGTTFKVPSKLRFVNDYLVNSCPSYYKRDYINKMFV